MYEHERPVKCLKLRYNPIKSGVFEKLNYPGGGGGREGSKAPPPPTISKNIVLIFTLSWPYILLGVPVRFFQNSWFWPLYSNFKIRSRAVRIIFWLFYLKWTSNTPKEAGFGCESNRTNFRSIQVLVTRKLPKLTTNM